MKGRLKGYKNPHREHLLDLDFLGNPSIVNKLRFEEFEAGADAMLKALREKGYHTYIPPEDNGVCLSSKGIKGKSGTLVFIPDEEK